MVKKNEQEIHDAMPIPPRLDGQTARLSFAEDLSPQAPFRECCGKFSGGLRRSLELAVEEEALPSLPAVLRLRLMVRDPFCLFAYWHVPASVRQEYAADTRFGPGHGRWVMRVFFRPPVVSVVPEEEDAFDVAIDPEQTGRYIEVPADRTEYTAELGLRAQDGTWVGLIRSNSVQTPRAKACDDRGTQWRVASRFAARYCGAASPAAGLPADGMPRPDTGSGPSTGDEREPLGVARIKAYYDRLLASLNRSGGRRRRKRLAPGPSEGLPPWSVWHRVDAGESSWRLPQRNVPPLRREQSRGQTAPCWHLAGEVEPGTDVCRGGEAVVCDSRGRFAAEVRFPDAERPVVLSAYSPRSGAYFRYVLTPALCARWSDTTPVQAPFRWLVISPAPLGHGGRQVS